jgi:hypothetical protein
LEEENLWFRFQLRMEASFRCLLGMISGKQILLIHVLYFVVVFVVLSRFVEIRSESDKMRFVGKNRFSEKPEHSNKDLWPKFMTDMIGLFWNSESQLNLEHQRTHRSCIWV